MLDPGQIINDFYSNFVPEELRLKREVQALKDNQNQTYPVMKKAKTVTPGTKYDLLNEVDPHRSPRQTLLFLKEEVLEDGSTQVVHNGTSSEAVLDVLIHRTTVQHENMKDKKRKKKLDNAIKQLGWAKDNIAKAFSEEEE